MMMGKMMQHNAEENKIKNSIQTIKSKAKSSGVG